VAIIGRSRERAEAVERGQLAERRDQLAEEPTPEPSTPSDEAREVERLRARVEELEGLLVEGERIMRVFDRKAQGHARALKSEYQRGPSKPGISRWAAPMPSGSCGAGAAGQPVAVS
jgi:hypothetical protein